ncbi:MAG: MBOAT family O-acyltransferase [Rhodocyclaceae bacterium]
MDIASPLFVFFALLVALCANAFPAPEARRRVMALSSAVFIVSHVDSAMALLPLALFLVLGFALVRVLQARPSTSTLVASLALVIVGFVHLKHYSFADSLPALPFIYLSLGLSYILFRLIHLMVDAAQGGLPARVGALDFFNYQCNFLSFVSGPIQRYQDYTADSARPLQLDDDAAAEGFTRILRGYVKLAVVSAIANHLYTILSARLGVPGPGVSMRELLPLYVATASTYVAYLYYNFAGYMDVVIGIGRLCGYKLPENFNRPFSARNFLEFWSRWHITLSDWFKVYVFNPLLGFLARRVTLAALQPFLGIAAFFLSFLLIGVWHGSTGAFLVYGLVLGGMASSNKLWQLAMARWPGKARYKSLCANPAYVALCRGMTFASFAVALTCFWCDLDRLAALSTGLGVSGAVLAFAALSVAGGALLWLGSGLSAALAPLAGRLAAWGRSQPLHGAAMGLQVLLIAVVGSFFHKAPEFVYRAF